MIPTIGDNLIVQSCSNLPSATAKIPKFPVKSRLSGFFFALAVDYFDYHFDYHRFLLLTNSPHEVIIIQINDY